MGPERRSERAGQRRRSKIPLACEPCRERKSRCDGAKPICSTCQRRSLPLHHCIYTLENARTASNEAYIKVLHDRIRRLEQTCTDHGIPIPPLGPGDGDGEGGPAPSGPSRLSPSALEQRRRSSFRESNPTGSLHEHTSPQNLRPPPVATSPDHERLDATESTASVTAMGTVSAEHGVDHEFDADNEFYGSSSAASFMKEAFTSVKTRAQPHLGASGTSVPSFRVNFARSDPPMNAQFAQVDKFALPPRNLADHLLSRFWDRVYWLYPLFDKPTFLRAYDSLWRSASEPATESSLPGLGLGSSPGGDAGTIVFHSALNTIFALGAQFSDLDPKDKASAIETFFNRAKAFVGLDYIDMNNLGVVQGLLLMAVLLQSTPFPSRCWNSVGLACRIAQGLGLHTESGRTSRSPLEIDIRRRTWHGCVILDMIVSMTYGRPTLTTHLPDLSFSELGGVREPTHSQAPTQDEPSKMCFYVEYIRQCRILGEILSKVYQPCTGGSSSALLSSWDEPKAHGMDAILELDAKLSKYETALPSTMSWTSPSDISGLDEGLRLIIVTQRTVLRGSFLYLRLMLHRPILTQLCANAESNPGTGQSSPARTGTSTVGQELFTSFAAGCAKICLNAAVDLIELVHSTYLTNTTAGWWWDGLYAFTAGLAVIVAYLSPPLLSSLDRQRLERSWMLCQGILSHFASFSISAQRSLRLLQKVHADVMSRSSDKDQEQALRVSAAHGGTAHGESVGARMEASVMPPDDMPLDLGGSFQWQLPVGSDMLGAGLVFNWDQSLDMIAGGLGMDIYQ